MGVQGHRHTIYFSRPVCTNLGSLAELPSSSLRLGPASLSLVARAEVGQLTDAHSTNPSWALSQEVPLLRCQCTDQPLRQRSEGNEVRRGGSSRGVARESCCGDTSAGFVGRAWSNRGDARPIAAFWLVTAGSLYGQDCSRIRCAIFVENLYSEVAGTGAMSQWEARKEGRKQGRNSIFTGGATRPSLQH